MYCSILHTDSRRMGSKVTKGHPTHQRSASAHPVVTCTMCGQVHSSPWPALVKIHQATAEQRPIMSFYCGNAYLTPICRSKVRHRSMSHDMYGQVLSSSHTKFGYDPSSYSWTMSNVIVKMHIWPLYVHVGQRSHAGQHQATCAGESIHHLEKFGEDPSSYGWTTSNYVILLRKCIFWHPLCRSKVRHRSMSHDMYR